jgi:hypothetical protein
MKKHLITVAMCLCCMAGMSQDLKTAADKRSTAIVVRLDSVAFEDAYRMAANVVQDAEFVVSASDAVLGTFTTDWKQASGFAVYYWQVSVSVRKAAGAGVEVHFRARTRNDHVPGEVVLEKRHNMGKDWDNLAALAARLGGVVLYL